MLKLSIVEANGQRRLVLEGMLIAPWTDEVESAWRRACENLEGRKLVIDLTNVTVISQEGESTLFNLTQRGAKFTCGGVLTKHLVRQVARRGRCPEAKRK